ncbi:MAG: M14 family zinc carboxypeptidase [Bdellovibrionales bacterium]
MKKLSLISILLCALIVGSTRQAQTEPNQLFVLKLKAVDSFQRSQIANTGASIEFVHDDYVIATAQLEEKNQLDRMGLVLERLNLGQILGFPSKDSEYHDYTEMTQKLQSLQARYPNLTRLISAGRSFEGRELWVMVIRAAQAPPSLPSSDPVHGRSPRS